jgi:adenylate cyclase
LQLCLHSAAPAPDRPVCLPGGSILTIISYQLHTRFHVWFPWAILVFAIAVAAAWSVTYNSISLYIQKRLLEQALSRVLPPKLVKIYANKPEFFKTGAEKQVLTILFSDIANFTSVSEGMDSDQLARLVNSYFDRAVPASHETDSAVLKFIGDAIFAIWNARSPAGSSLRACRAIVAARSIDRIQDWKLQRQPANVSPHGRGQRRQLR